MVEQARGFYFPRACRVNIESELAGAYDFYDKTRGNSKVRWLGLIISMPVEEFQKRPHRVINRAGNYEDLRGFLKVVWVGLVLGTETRKKTSPIQVNLEFPLASVSRNTVPARGKQCFGPNSIHPGAEVPQKRTSSGDRRIYIYFLTLLARRHI